MIRIQFGRTIIVRCKGCRQTQNTMLVREVETGNVRVKVYVFVPLLCICAQITGIKELVPLRKWNTLTNNLLRLESFAPHVMTHTKLYYWTL
ncbi:hypothetical protein Plhal703r1_c23g0097991 [Plasmopara halstedii]